MGQVFAKPSGDGQEDNEPDESTSAEWLCRKLRGKLFRTDHDTSFLPIDAFAGILETHDGKDKLDLFISELCSNHRKGLSTDQLRKYIHTESHATAGSGFVDNTRGSKIFSLLLLLEKPETIIKFMDARLTDEQLPFQLKSTTGQARAEVFSGKKSIQKVFSDWRDSDIDAFGKTQWSVLSPFFQKPHDGIKTKVFHCDLNRDAILPFETSGESSLCCDQGTFGLVFKVKIHPKHCDFEGKDEENKFFAVKKLKWSDEKTFQNEAKTLRRFSIDPHKHLVQLLATYKHGNTYYLIFPWADGNLRDLWNQCPSPKISPELCRWMAEQCLGLAIGLKDIHVFKPKHTNTALRLSSSIAKPYGRHGDMKPENILWFKGQDTISTSNGVLQIADFGLTTFHSAGSRSPIPPSDHQFGMTYRAPECDIAQQRISWRSDVWALGCIYLEFITWSLKGHDTAIKEFSNQRAREGESTRFPEMREDTFFAITSSAQNRAVGTLKSTVTKWIEDLHKHPNCTPYHEEFLDCIEKLLLLPEADRRGSCKILTANLRTILDKCCDESSGPAYCSVIANSPISQVGPSNGNGLALKQGRDGDHGQGIQKTALKQRWNCFGRSAISQ